MNSWPRRWNIDDDGVRRHLVRCSRSERSHHRMATQRHGAPREAALLSSVSSRSFAVASRSRSGTQPVKALPARLPVKVNLCKRGRQTAQLRRDSPGEAAIPPQMQPRPRGVAMTTETITPSHSVIGRVSAPLQHAVARECIAHRQQNRTVRHQRLAPSTTAEGPVRAVAAIWSNRAFTAFLLATSEVGNLAPPVSTSTPNTVRAKLGSPVRYRPTKVSESNLDIPAMSDRQYAPGEPLFSGRPNAQSRISTIGGLRRGCRSMTIQS